jgi:hypothetical protein
MDLGYLPEAECGVLLDRAETISRQITGFIKYLRSTKREN